jgi:hypothetical protein
MVVAGAATLLIAGLLPGAVAADAPYQVIAGGLHSPRGLTFGPGGRLYVAEAGQGGSGGSPIGYNGSIDEIVGPASAHPSLRTVVSGLASIGDEGEIVGVDGISAQGNGGIFAIMALSEPATGSPDFGKLLKVSTDGDVKVVADVGTPNYEWTDSVKGDTDYSPPGEQQYPDSNPYGVLALPGHQYVVDAGANTLNEVLPNGQVKILAFFENTSITDSTPTCVAQGPDGALYIGMLYLVDSFSGPAAKVYRVDPASLPTGGDVPILGTANVWASGLFPINGCAFGPDGTLYVSQLFDEGGFGSGDVVAIPSATHADPSTYRSLTHGALPFAGGVAVAKDGTVYAVGGTAFMPTGFVARLSSH